MLIRVLREYLRPYYGPLALVQLDAHQDTWSDDGDRLDHGTFVGRAVRAGLIDPARSIQVGIRTHAPEDCGIAITTAFCFFSASSFAVHSAHEVRCGSAAPPAATSSSCSALK